MKLGWIIPDGKFIECGHSHHATTAEYVVGMKERELEKIAVKVLYDQNVDKVLFKTLRRKLTDDQLKTIRKYCLDQEVMPPHKYFVQKNLEDLEGLPLNQVLQFI